MTKHRDDADQAKSKRKRSPVRKLLFWSAVGIGAAAVVQELRKPAEERTWTGQVAGLVPYDLRWPPTVERFQQAMWNPDSDELITRHPFGVGWSVNFAKIAQIGQEALEASKR